MVLGTYKRRKWLKSAAGLKSSIPNHNLNPSEVRERERREACPISGRVVVVVGGNAGEVIQEDHSICGGRMRDGESDEATEEANIA